MCLSVIYKGKQKAEALAKLPDVVTGYSMTMKYKERYYPVCQQMNTPFVAGRNEAIQCQVEPIPNRYYQAGFHRYLSRRAARLWVGDRIMSCKIHKKDITAIGEQQGALCVVAKQITCPQYCGKKGD